MKRIMGFLVLSLLMAGCFSQIAPSPAPSPSAAVTPHTPTPTSTVDWFPPTDTPTPYATSQATPTTALLKDVGRVVFEEDFLSLQAWTLPQTQRGEINLDRGELNIIIKEPDSYLAAVRKQPELENFFLEITASPSLCQGKDEYGVLFRAAGQNTYYRFGLSCDGEARLDRILPGQVFSVQPWLSTASVPRGAPSESRLGILAVGDEISLFVDRTLQFRVTDGEIRRGTLGVFARSVGETAVTVGFSDLIVREVRSAQETNP